MKIYEMILENDFWTEREETLLPYVSEQRKNRITKYRFEIDRKLSLYGALLVKLGIYKWNGIIPAEQRFLCENLKKPKLLNQPAVEFNLSHTRSAVVCGFSEFPVGVDIERIDTETLANTACIFTEDEQKKFIQGNVHERAEQICRLWTCKEAYAKWNGLGLSQDISKINTDLPGFNSWKTNDYIISVYSKSDNIIQRTSIDETAIAEFYINNLQNKLLI